VDRKRNIILITADTPSKWFLIVIDTWLIILSWGATFCSITMVKPKIYSFFSSSCNYFFEYRIIYLYILLKFRKSICLPQVRQRAGSNWFFFRFRLYLCQMAIWWKCIFISFSFSSNAWNSDILAQILIMTVWRLLLPNGIIQRRNWG